MRSNDKFLWWKTIDMPVYYAFRHRLNQSLMLCIPLHVFSVVIRLSLSCLTSLRFRNERWVLCLFLSSSETMSFMQWVSRRNQEEKGKMSRRNTDRMMFRHALHSLLVRDDDDGKSIEVYSANCKPIPSYVSLVFQWLCLTIPITFIGNGTCIKFFLFNCIGINVKL